MHKVEWWRLGVRLFAIFASWRSFRGRPSGVCQLLPVLEQFNKLRELRVLGLVGFIQVIFPNSVFSSPVTLLHQPTFLFFPVVCERLLFLPVLPGVNFRPTPLGIVRVFVHPPPLPEASWGILPSGLCRRPPYVGLVIVLFSVLLLRFPLEKSGKYATEPPPLCALCLRLYL